MWKVRLDKGIFCSVGSGGVESSSKNEQHKG